MSTRSAGDRINEVWRDGRAVLGARWYLRHADVVGSRVRVRGRPVVANHGRMVIGGRVQLVSTVARIELTTAPGGTLEIGERTLVNYGTTIGATGHVRIGARCLIGTHVMIMDNDFHHVEPERRLERPEPRRVSVGDNVWIGGRSIILPGVSIGTDSCVAAGSVVAHDVPARTLVAGVPARVIRSL